MSDNRTHYARGVDHENADMLRAAIEDADRRGQERIERAARKPNADALKYARGVLQNVVEDAVRARRRAGRPLTTVEIQALLDRVSDDALSTTARELISLVNDGGGDRTHADEFVREEALRFAREAPITFEAPVDEDNDPAALAARIPR